MWLNHSGASDFSVRCLHGYRETAIHKAAAFSMLTGRAPMTSPILATSYGCGMIVGVYEAQLKVRVAAAAAEERNVLGVAMFVYAPSDIVAH